MIVPIYVFSCAYHYHRINITVVPLIKIRHIIFMIKMFNSEIWFEKTLMILPTSQFWQKVSSAFVDWSCLQICGPLFFFKFLKQLAFVSNYTDLFSMWATYKRVFFVCDLISFLLSYSAVVANLTKGSSSGANVSTAISLTADENATKGTNAEPTNSGGDGNSAKLENTSNGKKKTGGTNKTRWGKKTNSTSSGNSTGLINASNTKLMNADRKQTLHFLYDVQFNTNVECKCFIFTKAAYRLRCIGLAIIHYVAMADTVNNNRAHVR